MQTKLFTCLNGRFVLAHRAAVSVADRGFRFGDGVFETLRVARGIPYQWDLHMARLMGGLAALSIIPPAVDLQEYARRLLVKNNAREGFLRISISRGSGSRGYAPYPPGMPASWVIEWIDGISAPSHPCRLWLARAAKIPPQCLPGEYKLAQGLNSTLALMEAHKNDCDEALQLSPEGMLSEAAGANIFWLKDMQLFTPALDSGCLAGTTREAVMRLSPLPVQVVRAGLSALEGAEAMFLTNCRVGIWPVAVLEPLGRAFRVSHPMHRQLLGLLERDRQRDYRAHHRQWSAV